jgi:hypothetical protein
MPADKRMSPELLQQLTVAILDGSADGGRRIIKTIRSYLDTWEVFLQDRHRSCGTISSPLTTPPRRAWRPIRRASTASTGKRTAAT